MLVTARFLPNVLEEISREKFLSVDTETTGLFPWKGDRLFAVVIGTAKRNYYFNFLWDQAFDGSTPPAAFVLKKEYVLPKIGELFTPDKTIFMHNAKFDLAMLRFDGVEVLSDIHDTEVAARLLRNDELSYELFDVAQRAGFSKSDAVEEYISKYKLWDWKSVPGKKTRQKNKKFYEVPFEIMSKYALIDADITYKIGMKQIEEFHEFDRVHSVGRPTLWGAFESEKRLTKVVFAMENAGMFTDQAYCSEAAAYEDARSMAATKRFKDLTGFEFIDSGKELSKAFSALGYPVPQTEKGNPSFTDKILEGFDNPVAEVVREYRDAAKRSNTYFKSFQFHADSEGVVHTNLKQAGTTTGRFSCREPNLQNLSKDEEEGLQFTVRKAFVPRPDYYFVMIDYDQMEFRMMLDYAGQMDLIEEIKKGLDAHQATADLTGLNRKAAKTLNFALIYGMGAEKLSKALGVDLMEAKKFRAKYFANLPRVEVFLQAAMRRAKQQGFVRSWDGRLYWFKDPDFSYKAPNAVIQGGCASVVKRAMPEINEVLRGTKSNLLMQIHDEILLEVHKDELHLVEKVKNIMEKAFPHKHIPLTCSVSHSLKSWGEPIDGMPDAARDALQDESSGRHEESETRVQKNLVHENSATIS